MKGILFEPDMIKAIREGRKSVTRRVIKPQPAKPPIFRIVMGRPELEYWYEPDSEGNIARIITPRYRVGETVYIKEAWAIKDCGSRVSLEKEVWPEGWPIDRLQYPATDPAPIPPELADDSKVPYWWNKRSPLFMPAWAARYFIKIKDVRAERLQEIFHNVVDVEREGIDTSKWWDKLAGAQLYVERITQFIELWNSINPQYPWETDPWVVRYAFIGAENERNIP